VDASAGRGADAPPPLVTLPDGTVKQVSPLTGTVVWTVPGRAHRFGVPSLDRRPVPPDDGAHCAFCPRRYRETPPEKARVVRDAGGAWRTVEHVPEAELDATVAEFRRFPNLFEIVSADYWRLNHGHVPAPEARARAEAYVAEPGGRAHVLAVMRRRAAAQGVTDDDWARAGEEHWLERAVDLFSGTHDVLVARRHFADGAAWDDELAGSGTLTPDEHRRYVELAVGTMADLYRAQPHARYVAAFQNWLRPAGASFDHLHKQLVAIDEHGPRTERVLARLATRPGIFNDVVDHAVDHGLVVAENEHAVAVAAVGHRYPSLEVYSRSRAHAPWEHDAEEVAAVADLLHALHAATGVTVPTNEEWHHRPPDVPARVGPMPWHVVLKWRVSTLAGFEGSTKINVNTLAPAVLREMVVERLASLRDAGAVAGVRVGDECARRHGTLRYAG
jgi:galactose-1-phosphate uridylyltransferase